MNEKTVIIQNWIQGKKYDVKEDEWNNINGTYNLTINSTNGSLNYMLNVKSNSSASVITKDTLTTKFSYNGKIITLSFSSAVVKKQSMRDTTEKNASSQRGRSGMRTASSFLLSGVVNGDIWNGNGEDTAGNRVTWTANFVKSLSPTTDSSRKKFPLHVGKVVYPFDGYGWDELPKQENILIKNATVWTSEQDARLDNTDVLVKNGKIVRDRKKFI